MTFGETNMQGVLVNSSKTQEKSSSAVGWESTKQWNNRVVSKWKKKEEEEYSWPVLFCQEFPKRQPENQRFGCFWKQ